MAQTNCRIPDPLDEKLEQASEERQAFKSEIFRRAVRYYIKNNPDDIRALRRPSDRNRRKQPPETARGAGRSDQIPGEESAPSSGRVREETVEFGGGETDQPTGDGDTAATGQNWPENPENGHQSGRENAEDDGETAHQDDREEDDLVDDLDDFLDDDQEENVDEDDVEISGSAPYDPMGDL